MYFYDNRVNYLMDGKKKARAEKKDNDHEKDLVFRHTIAPSEKSQKSAELFRKKYSSK